VATEIVIRCDQCNDVDAIEYTVSTGVLRWTVDLCERHATPITALVHELGKQLGPAGSEPVLISGLDRYVRGLPGAPR
jgi:hypothetical protein